MIVGNGLLASGFLNSNESYDNFIIFASGVSDSKCSNLENFDREKKLILSTIEKNKELKLIYFSSILAGIANNHYYNHKIEIENLIKNNSNNYIIFRAPQIIGHVGNKNNLVNNLKKLIINNENIIINKNINRALLDVDDLINIVNYCKNKIVCETINISYIEKISVFDLVEKISIFLNKTPKIQITDSNEYCNWSVENSEIINECITNLNIKKISYTDNIIKKYLNN